MASLPAAAASTGTDWQWDAYARLLSEIADDIAEEGSPCAAASAQTAIVNGRRRLESVVHAATRSNMPQVSTANAARRSREWVRRATEPKGN